MRKVFVIAAVLLLVWNATAHAAPLTGTTKFDLNGVESNGYKQAVSSQSAALNAAWGTGAITFGRGGIPVFFVSEAQVRLYCFNLDAIGCHANNGSQRYILVASGLPSWETQYAIDHEILETMVDPYPWSDPTLSAGGQYEEICDPNERIVWHKGYALAAWVGPPYFGGTNVIP